MPWYKEYKGELVHWATKGAKGKAKPTGKAVKLPTRKQQVWERRKGKVYSYEKLSEKEVKRLGLKKKTTKHKAKPPFDSIFGF